MVGGDQELLGYVLNTKIQKRKKLLGEQKLREHGGGSNILDDLQKVCKMMSF